MAETAPKRDLSQGPVEAEAPKTVEPKLTVVGKADAEQELQGVDDPHDAWTKTAFLENIRKNKKVEKENVKADASKAAVEKQPVPKAPEADTQGIEHMSPEEWKADQTGTKPEKDLKEYAEHFGILAEAQGGNVLAESKTIDALTEQVRRDRANELDNRLEQRVERELADELSKLNTKDAQKALENQIDEDLKIAAGSDLTLTPTQQRGLENLRARAIREASAKLEAANKQRAEKLGFWGTLKKFKEQYDDRNLRTKVAISEGLRSLATSKNRNRALAVLGAAAIAGILFALYRRSGTLPEVDTGVIPPAQGFGDDPINWEETAKLYPPQGFGDDPALVPQAPPTPGSMEIFTNDALVGRNSTVWRIAEGQLQGQNEFMALGREQKDYVLDSYMKYIQSLGSNAIKSMGIESGNINTIYIGEHIRLDGLNDRSLFDTFVSKARVLTPEEITRIAHYRATHTL